MSTVIDGWSAVTPLPGMDPYEMQNLGGGKGKLLVLFRKFQKHMIKESELQGRPVFKEVDYITIIVPGDQKLVLDHEVKQADKDRFPIEWAHWQNKQQNRIPGIPIEHWPQLTETQKAECKALGIHTVEQFASLSDANGQKIMGYSQLKQKALVYLEVGKDSELLGRVRAEAEERQKALEEQNAQLLARLEALEATISGKKK